MVPGWRNINKVNEGARHRQCSSVALAVVEEQKQSGQPRGSFQICSLRIRDRVNPETRGISHSLATLRTPWVSTIILGTRTVLRTAIVCNEPHVVLQQSSEMMFLVWPPSDARDSETMNGKTGIGKSSSVRNLFASIKATYIIGGFWRYLLRMSGPP